MTLFDKLAELLTSKKTIPGYNGVESLGTLSSVVGKAPEEAKPLVKTLTDSTNNNTLANNSTIHKQVSGKNAIQTPVNNPIRSINKSVPRPADTEHTAKVPTNILPEPFSKMAEKYVNTQKFLHPVAPAASSTSQPAPSAAPVEPMKPVSGVSSEPQSTSNFTFKSGPSTSYVNTQKFLRPVASKPVGAADYLNPRREAADIKAVEEPRFDSDGSGERATGISTAQQDMFKLTGNRAKTPEEFNAFVNKYLNAPDMEKAMEELSPNTRRYIRFHVGMPEEQKQKFMQSDAKLAPGFVQNEQSPENYKVAFARNTGVADVDGKLFVNDEDLDVLAKLGYSLSIDEYLGLEKTSEALDLYSYIEKVAGVPKSVAKAVDKGEAFSGSLLEDMGYSVPKGYEVKGDLCCPVASVQPTQTPNTLLAKRGAEYKTLFDKLKDILNKESSEKPGLWANVHAKKARGEKAAKPGDEAYPDKKQWDKLTKAAAAAWQRSEGKNPEGGLNAKGRASYKRETGGTLKAPVTESDPEGERAKRQNSFCSRMCGMKSKNTGSKGQSDPDSRINKSLRKWNCKCGEDHESLYEKVACLVKEANGRCWEGYKPVPGKEPYSEDSCEPVGAKKKKDSELEKKSEYKWHKSKDLHRDVTNGRHYPFSFLTGEAKELIDAIKNRDMANFKEEIGDTTYAAQMLAAQATGLNHPVFADLSKFYKREKAWKDIFNEKGGTYHPKHMEGGSNYAKPSKIIKAFTSAGIKINQAEAERIAHKYTGGNIEKEAAKEKKASTDTPYSRPTVENPYPGIIGDGGLMAEEYMVNRLANSNAQAAVGKSKVPVNVSSLLGKARMYGNIVKAAPAVGVVTQANGAYDRYKKQDYLGSAIDGVGALGSAAQLAHHPVAKGVGLGVSTASTVANAARDIHRYHNRPVEFRHDPAVLSNPGEGNPVQIPNTPLAKSGEASHEFEVSKHKLDLSYALNSVKYLGKQADDEEQDLIDEAKLKRRFKYWATKMRNHGVMAGTYHKRIAIPKYRLPKEHLERLGFEPVAIAIPEAGQDEFASYRNPHNLFHLHSHGNHWTMHEDEHPSLTMALRNAPIEKVPEAVASGLSHIVTEGVPGGYKYISHRLTGAGNMLDAIMNETAAKQKNSNTIDSIKPA